MQKNFNNKKIIKQFATSSYPYSLKEAKKWVDICIQNDKIKGKSRVNFVIEINNEVAGVIHLKEIKEHKAEIGYWIAEKYWGQGIGSEAINLLTEYAFNKFKLKRVYAKIFINNISSTKAVEKAGFEYEGILRKDVNKKGKLVDIILYSKIKAE